MFMKLIVMLPYRPMAELEADNERLKLIADLERDLQQRLSNSRSVNRKAALYMKRNIATLLPSSSGDLSS